jgi:hypothetical protein
MSDILAFPPELLNKKTTAYMLSTSEWGVGELVRLNKLTPIVDGGKWMKFRLSNVREYIDSLPERKTSA